MAIELKISVITVCFNSAATITDTLRSLDDQSWPNREHWIIDGASRDDTMSIVDADRQPWRRVVSERDSGIYDAMNKGIRLAQGDVIGFINSDDFFATPQALAMVAAAFADSSVDVCYGDLCYVKQDDVGEVVRYWRSSEFRPGLFLRGWCPPHPTLFVRRSVYERFGPFDLQYSIASDIEMMIRLFEVQRVKSRYLPEILVKMRMGGTTNRSWSNVLQQNREIWHALQGHDLHPSLPIFVGGKLWLRGRQFLTRPT